MVALARRLGVPLLLAGVAWLGSEMVQLRLDVDRLQTTAGAASELAAERRELEKIRAAEISSRTSLIEERLRIVEGRVAANEAVMRATGPVGPR